jgi:hypothetical protein
VDGCPEASTRLLSTVELAIATTLTLPDCHADEPVADHGTENALQGGSDTMFMVIILISFPSSTNTHTTQQSSLPDTVQPN